VCITAGDDNSIVPVFFGASVDFLRHILVTGSKPSFLEDDQEEGEQKWCPDHHHWFDHCRECEGGNRWSFNKWKRIDRDEQPGSED